MTTIFLEDFVFIQADSLDDSIRMIRAFLQSANAIHKGLIEGTPLFRLRVHQIDVNVIVCKMFVN